MALSGGGHLINLFTLEDADLDGLPERASIGSIEVTSATGINYPSDLGCSCRFLQQCNSGRRIVPRFSELFQSKLYLLQTRLQSLEE